MYKAILFDLGKVLIHFDFARGYQALEGCCPYPTAGIRSRLAATDLVKRFETGLVEPRDFFRELSAILELKLDYEGFCSIWCSIFTDPLVPESLVESLARRYRLVLLSNTNAIHFPAVLETYPVLRRFHEMVLSHEVKAMKPEPKIFLEAVRRAGCQPAECFYTDDIPAFTEAARQLGIDAVTFESVAQLERELEKRGIG
jgi:putative hydrolase of the HAD superfamily